MIIDAHTHICESGIGPLGTPAGAEDLLRDMDQAGIDAAVVIPHAGLATNTFVQRECRRFPDRFFALYTPDFSQPGTSLVEDADRFVRNHDVRGIKIHPRAQQVTVDDALVLELLDWASGLKRPVVFDAFPFGPSAADPRLAPLAYVAAATARPNLQIVLAHAGGHRPVEAFLAVKAAPNIGVDISFTVTYYEGTSIPGDLRFLCDRVPPSRVAYGSDYPFVGLQRYLDRTRALLESLPAARQREIWSATAAAWFGIGDTTASEARH